MNYSTLKEAYSIDSFDKEKKKSKKSKTVKIEEFEDDSSDISQRDVKTNQYNQQQRTLPNPKHPEETRSASVNVLKNVQPHYDEELEKYLNVNDFQDNNLHYYPQDHTKSYNNTNFSSPPENNSYIGYENDGKYEPTQPYYRQVSPAPPRNLHNNLRNKNDEYVERPTRQQQSRQMNSEEREIEARRFAQLQDQRESRKVNYPEPLPKSPEKAIIEEKDTFYKNLVNIGLFIFIGILIIFLCEQISEIAINIGMKKTIMILEPYMKKDVKK